MPASVLITPNQSDAYQLSSTVNAVANENIPTFSILFRDSSNNVTSSVKLNGKVFMGVSRPPVKKGKVALVYNGGTAIVRARASDFKGTSVRSYVYAHQYAMKYHNSGDDKFYTIARPDPPTIFHGHTRTSKMFLELFHTVGATFLDSVYDDTYVPIKPDEIDKQDMLVDVNNSNISSSHKAYLINVINSLVYTQEMTDVPPVYTMPIGTYNKTCENGDGIIIDIIPSFDLRPRYVPPTTTGSSSASTAPAAASVSIIPQQQSTPPRQKKPIRRLTTPTQSISISASTPGTTTATRATEVKYVGSTILARPTSPDQNSSVQANVSTPSASNATGSTTPPPEYPSPSHKPVENATGRQSKRSKT